MSTRPTLITSDPKVIQALVDYIQHALHQEHEAYLDARAAGGTRDLLDMVETIYDWLVDEAFIPEDA